MLVLIYISHSLIILPNIIYILAFLAFIFSSRHLLNTLLALEFLALSTYFIIIFSYRMLINEYFCVFLFLAIIVCEGVLGLSLVVLYVRRKGNALIIVPKI